MFTSFIFVINHKVLAGTDGADLSGFNQIINTDSFRRALLFSKCFFLQEIFNLYSLMHNKYVCDLNS